MHLAVIVLWQVLVDAFQVPKFKTILFVTHSIQEAVFLASHCAVLTAGPARMAEYFPIELPFPRDLPIKTTDEFGAYARRIYASLGLGARA